MRWFSAIIVFLYNFICSAQVIENPVFDRTDVPSFHIDKIEITKDTTFVYCTYYAEEGSWANISPETYLEDVETGKKYTILGSEGLPFGPTKRDFESNQKCDVRLLFPSIFDATKLNFIENPNESAFNIWGIDLQMSFTSQFTVSDIDKFRKLAKESENANDCKSAIEYTFKQLESSKFFYGNKSTPCAYAMYNLTMFYFEVKEYDKVIEWGDKTIDILNSLPSDSLNLDVIARTYGNIGKAYIKKKQNDIAFDILEESLSLRKRLEELKPGYLRNPNFFNFLYGLVQCYFEANKTEKLISLLNYAKSLCEDLYTKCSDEYLKILSKCVYYYYLIGNIDTALKCAQEAYTISLELYKNDLGCEPTIICVTNLMRLYNHNKDYKSTINLGQKHHMLIEYNHDIAESLSDAYEELNDWGNAIIFRKNSLALVDSQSVVFYREMDKLSSLYMSNGDYLKSKMLYDKIESMNDSFPIQDSVVYANILSHISVLSSNLGNFSKASEYAQKSKHIRYKLLNSNLNDKQTLYGNYLLSILNVATEMINSRNDDAISVLNEGVDFINNNKESLNYQNLLARLISLKGSYYKMKGLFREALVLFDQASNMQIQDDSLDYIQTLYQKAETHMSLNDYDSAMQVLVKAKEIAESVVGEHHPTYASILNILAVLNYYYSNYSQSLKFIRDSYEIYKASYGYYSKQFAIILNNLASTYSSIGEWQKERQLKKEALHILEHIDQNYGILYSTLCKDVAPYDNDSILFYFDKAKKGLVLCGEENSKTMVAILQAEASYYTDIKDTVQAINCINAAIDIIRKYGGERSIEYAHMYNELSNIDKHFSLEHAEKAFQLYQKLYNRNSMAYALSMFDYGKALFLNDNKTDSVIYLLQEASDIMKAHFRENAYIMPFKDTSTYWNEVLGVIFNHWLPLICSSYNNSNSNQLLYDYLLFSKGLLLSTETNFRKSILTSGDDSLINIYKKFVEISAILDFQFSLPTNIRSANIDSFLKDKEKYDWQLSKILNNKGFQSLKNYTWVDVKEQLKEKDLAVEFGNYYTDTNIIYYALIVDKHSHFPKLVKLFDMESIIQLIKKEMTDPLELSNLIWKPIFEDYTNVENVYFSPNGILNMYGIEYLPINKFDSDTLNFYRLSSTKVLCEMRGNGNIKNAILYGGINYNLAQSEKEELGEYDFSDSYKELTRSICMRGDFEPLQNSEEEVNAISNLLISNGVKCELYKCDIATEKSLKLLSGKPVGVLHLATHGMYIDASETRKKISDNMQFVILDDSAEKEEKALSRSFLVMSGGNQLVHRDSVLHAGDDGILTALEISHLNFKYLDIVVLSACQSALGDITSEGIYGLQRGFKKAGANTILMSLDKVDDEATKILMVEFYRNLMTGKTKHQSLKDAQKYLRSVENRKYDDSKYWASFILLDGLN
jgi:tetratricopeptide (TPR) repeat protein